MIYGDLLQVRAIRRENAAKIDIPRGNLIEQVIELLDTIQQSLFDAAKEKRDACIQIVKTWDEFVDALGKRKMILAPWCDEEVMYKLKCNDFLFIIQVLYLYTVPSWY